jgi:hypothetical protein
MQVMGAVFIVTLATAAGQVSATTLQVRSEVEGFRITEVDALPAPRNAQAFKEDDFCDGIQIQPKTRAGRHAASLGWHVTSETSLNGFDAVGVFSRGGAATSGTCLISDGNIVLYRDHQPVAIVYEPSAAPDTAGRIGGVVTTLSPDRLRISDWTPPAYQSADIVLVADAITVAPIAAMETACGQVQVPNLRGLAIPAVRKALAPHGWKPAAFPNTDDTVLDAASTHRNAGLTEFETCAGTGYGFCSVRYIHATGTVLDVTTTGEDPEVSGYEVQCSAPAP